MKKYDTNHPQVDGYFRLKLGDFEITALCDGIGTFHSYLCTDYTSLTAAELDELTARDFTPIAADGGAELAINAFLVNTGENLILIDTGKGYVQADIFLEKHGLVTQSLKASGYAAEDIDAILITHLHTDHIGGAEENGQRIFPNATIYLSEEEKIFWLETEVSSLSEGLRLYAKLAQIALKPYVEAGRVKTFTAGAEIFPNVKSVPLFGHTAGHTGYLISSKGESLFIWGDLLHAKAIQLVRPDVGIVFDSDARAACRTREKILPKLAENKQLVGGSHLPFPGIGYIEKQGESYNFHPVEYRVIR